jgi:hypothetical protein
LWYYGTPYNNGMGIIRKDLTSEPIFCESKNRTEKNCETGRFVPLETFSLPSSSFYHFEVREINRSSDYRLQTFVKRTVNHRERV